MRVQSECCLVLGGLLGALGEEVLEAVAALLDLVGRGGGAALADEVVVDLAGRADRGGDVELEARGGLLGRLALLLLDEVEERRHGPCRRVEARDLAPAVGAQFQLVGDRVCHLDLPELVVDNLDSLELRESDRGRLGLPVLDLELVVIDAREVFDRRVVHLGEGRGELRDFDALVCEGVLEYLAKDVERGGEGIRRAWRWRTSIVRVRPCEGRPARSGWGRA